MDRNSITGFVLIAAILGLYTWYSMPNAEQRAQMEREQRAQDSLAAQVIQREEAEQQRAAEVQRQQVSPDTLRAAASDTLNADSLHAVALQQRFGPFAIAAEGTPTTVEIANNDVQVGISTHGARPVVMRLKQYVTHDTLPLLLADPDSGLYEFDFFLGNLKLSTKDLHFTPVKQDERSVQLRAATNDPGRYVQINYTLDSSGYFMHTQAELVGMADALEPRSLVFRWEVAGLSNEKYRDGELRKNSVYYKYVNDDREYLSETDADEKKLEGRTNWVAFKQDFFTLAMISDEGFTNGSEISVTPLQATTHTKHFAAELFFDKEPADKVVIPLKFYLGPNHFGTLRRTEVPQFERIIDLGWGIFGWMNRWLVIPIFNWLDGWGWNYGIIILVLTIVIKLLLMPLTWKNYISSAKMRVLKPEMDAINEKNKDADPLKKQQATMDLYRKAGVNPASGCLPMLVQMPVLFAMFKFFPSSIELRQQSFLWAHDLSTYDSVLTWSGNIPFLSAFYGNHMSLFTILMAASTIVYTVINSKQMPTQQGMPGMKLMMYLFPVMMLFFMNSLPAGLSYYYLLANVISILQMTMFKHLFVNEDKIRAELLKNMKTPKKKSRWQQRLEDMQKQQQAARKR